MKKIWCISDIHGLHNELKIPGNIDAIIVAGDMSNARNRLINFGQMMSFLEWLKVIDVKTKIIVAGNHDTSLEFGQYFDKEKMEATFGVIYLEHETVVIDGLKIFGSPYTPTFGNGWAFNKDRGKLHNYWTSIEEGTDIVITHGPPKGILDLSRDSSNTLDFCGDLALKKKVMSISPKYHIFGHIHNYEDCINQGIRIYEGVTYVNASCVTDKEFGKGPSSNGIIIEL